MIIGISVFDSTLGPGGAGLTEAAVAAELRRQLPEYAMPLIYRLAAWPHLVNGKVAIRDI